MTTFPKGHSARRQHSRNAKTLRRIAATVDWEYERRLALSPRGRPSDDQLVIWLISRDGADCYLCGDTPVKYHVDHVMPRAHGGTDDFWNLALTCPTCNLRKSAYIIAFQVRDRSPRFCLPV